MQANVNKFVAAIHKFAAANNNAAKQLREAAVAAGFKTPEQCRPAVVIWASEHFGIPTVESTSNANKGETVLDRSHPKFGTAKKSIQRAVARIMEALTGDADKPASSAKGEKKDGVEVPADIAALAAKLAAACNEYEGAKRLAAQAVAEAFAALKAK